ncbi:DNA polymerase III subunit alpha [Limihaloglobus sulfuriphilus]|uniref:DNA polymerase III subunit alpha n=2 Tax=Limihaloglobus sulfuriphilus TaxID=1851148 RepID=A0A1Q2MB11_9BACT|nr:DNA polymerase III subunit alpha [Limihaloglobus sulfuriphilus]
MYSFEFDFNRRQVYNMSDKGFCHLHLHTQFSLLDGGIVPKKLFARCKELGMDTVAITDHGNLFGIIDFYRNAIAAGIKPIIGMEAYFSATSRFDQNTTSKDNHHLILLARNKEGYQNLLKLSSLAYTEGFRYRPRIDEELLRQFGSGLIGTSACMSGEIPRLLAMDRPQEARAAAERYCDIFGEGNFYIELQRHDFVEQDVFDQTPMLADLAREMGIGMICSNDVHFLNKDDYEAHDALTCISTGKLVSDKNRMKYPPSVYLKSPLEMRELFHDFPEACDNTLEIAKRCDIEIDLQARHAPSFTPPKGAAPGQYLRELVYDGAKRLYGEITDEVRRRIEREIEVIDGKGFSSYFLIIWELCNWAAEHGIPTGARGSGVGTIVGYCLGLCNVDPIKYGLLFERFMDPERNEMPDIDIDMCQDGRPRLLEYVREKYGDIAQITTFGTMKAKGVVRDVSRVLDVPLAKANELAKMIPEDLKMTLDKALEENREIKDKYESDPEVRHVFDIGRKLEGLARHSSVHACAVVIADEPLTNFLPVYKQSGSDDLITQFEGPDVEAVGLLKMDFLGLKTLSVIEAAKKWVEAIHGEKIDIEAINLEDPKVFEVFGSGRTKGVFQFESDGMADLLMKLKPDRVEDLIAANALYRPGPMALIPDFIAYKHGEKQWSVPHPIMEDILEETFGIMVYQEQVMQVCHKLGDIKLREAYKLIKAISKKKEKVIAKAKEQFVKGCVDKGLQAKQADEIFELIRKFAGYGFNKSHASRYSIVAYQTAYMKAYWPCEFMASLLTYEHETSKIVLYIKECKTLGIDVLPPDINESFTNFTVVYDNEDARKAREGKIRFGLGAVKGVGGKAVDKVIEAREKVGSFKSLFHFCENVDLRSLNKQVIEALIKAGAFDRLGGSRAQHMAAVENAIKFGQDSQADAKSGQMSLFGDMEDAASLGKSDAASLPDVPAWPEMQMLRYEKDVLGMFVTSNPLSKHADTITAYSTAHTDELSSLGSDADVVIGGIITQIRYRIVQKGSRAGSKWAIVHIEDFNGETEAKLFTEVLSRYGHLLEEDKVVFIQGKIDHFREKPCISCEKVIDLSCVDKELSTTIRLRFRSEDIKPDLVSNIKALCRLHPGKSPVYAVVQSGDMLVQLDLGCRVAPLVEFRDQLRQIVGDTGFELARR